MRRDSDRVRSNVNRWVDSDKKGEPRMKSPAKLHRNLPCLLLWKLHPPTAQTGIAPR